MRPSIEEEILDKDATVYLAVTLLVHLDQKLLPANLHHGQ